MERIAYDVISLPIFLPQRREKQKVSKHSSNVIATPSDDEREIAFQFGLDPAKFAQQVALNHREGGTEKGLYVSTSTGELMRRVSYHQSDTETDLLVRALSDATQSAVSANERGDSLSLDAAVRSVQSTCAKLLAIFQA